MSPRHCQTGAITGITAALSESCLHLVEAVLTGTGTPVSFDVNYRPVRRAGPVLRDLARRADIVFVGRDEVQTLWGTATPESVRRPIPEPKLLAVKDGSVGATEFYGGQMTFVPANPVDVVEAVGGAGTLATTGDYAPADG